MDKRRIVMFSGGVASWATARRVVDKHGNDNLTLLFADTRSEHESTYRFLHEANEDIGGELVTLTDPKQRDVWGVFFDEGMIGNTRADLCSRILKREPMRQWLERECDPADTIVYLGFGWEEAHRLARSRPFWEPWMIDAPLTREPYELKQDLIKKARERGLTVPILYDHGFAHGNCSGFCIKAGHGQFKRLLETMPDVYAHHEAKEQEFRETFGKDVSVMRDRKGGVTKPLTLKGFRERIEANQTDQMDLLDWGASCSCMEETE